MIELDKEIKFLEKLIKNKDKTGSYDSLIGLTPIAFDYLFRVTLFLLKKEKEKEEK